MLSGKLSVGSVWVDKWLLISIQRREKATINLVAIVLHGRFHACRLPCLARSLL